MFHPTWAGGNGTIIISETFVRLPVWAMSPYAMAVLDRFRPSKCVLSVFLPGSAHAPEVTLIVYLLSVPRVLLLDAYSTATYISLAGKAPRCVARLRFHFGFRDNSDQYLSCNLSNGSMIVNYITDQRLNNRIKLSHVYYFDLEV